MIFFQISLDAIPRFPFFSSLFRKLQKRHSDNDWSQELRSNPKILSENTGKVLTRTWLVLLVGGAATAMFHSSPPVFASRFCREILHSCTFTDRKQASGKKVIVIGGGKSAIDNVVSAAKESSEPPTLVCRNWHWPVPRLLLNLVPFKYGTYSRFGHWMLHPYYGEGSVAQWFHGTCAPVKWIWWRVVELMFRGQFHIKSALGLIVNLGLITPKSDKSPLKWDPPN